MVKLVVIGAGIVGASVAAHAASLGADVTLLDACTTPGAGTTDVSFAWLNSNDKAPDSYHAFNVRGMEEYEGLHRALGGMPWHFPCGNIEWASKGGSTELANRATRLEALGYPVRLLTGQELVSCA